MFEESPDAAGDELLDAADGFAFGLAFGDASSDGGAATMPLIRTSQPAIHERQVDWYCRVTSDGPAGAISFDGSTLMADDGTTATERAAESSTSARLGSLVAEAPHLTPAVSAPANFRFGQVSSEATLNPAVIAASAPALGPLAAFVGTWTGTGFNTIFRPNSPQTPTQFPAPVSPPSDNVLELNLTSEVLSFSPSLGSVPNRGMVQADAFLNGTPYLQTVSDVTVAGQTVGIHVEPGLWMAVPPTADPAEGPTFVRMASIPHGTTIVAQGTSATLNGAPNIPPVDITPSLIGGGSKIPFPSQTASIQDTSRIPQDLSAWISAGTITQAMLDDPNSLLRDHIAGHTITQTSVISISTGPALPLFGGGTGNIAFLLGDPAASSPNADAVGMTATFWIETVQHTLNIPVFADGQTSIMIPAGSPAGHAGPSPNFIVTPPHPIDTPQTITFTTQQIQYTQTVVLNFNGLSWPHVSVATLLPAGPATVPPSAWS